MSKIAYIRIATYVVLILAFFAARNRPRLIPLEISAGCDDSELFSSPQWSGLASEFLEHKRSMPAVISLARELAEKQWHRADEPEPSEPLITGVTLRKSDGRIIWTVSFYDPERGPLGISIDDLTGVPVRELRKESLNQRTDKALVESLSSSSGQASGIHHP